MEYSPFSLKLKTLIVTFSQPAVNWGLQLLHILLLEEVCSPENIAVRMILRRVTTEKLAPRYSPDNFSKNLILVDELRELATRKGCTVGQLTLAWLLALGDDIIPIPGTKNLKNFDENMEALTIQLPTGEVQEIRDLVDKAVIHGERYPSTSASLLFANTVNL